MGEAEIFGKYSKQKKEWFPFSSREKKRYGHEFGSIKKFGRRQKMKPDWTLTQKRASK